MKLLDYMEKKLMQELATLEYEHEAYWVVRQPEPVRMEQDLTAAQAPYRAMLAELIALTPHDSGHCPICGKELIKVYEHGGPMGTEESMYECPGHYSENFAYGSTEITVGDFMTGYHYTTSTEEVNRINALVYQVGLLYKGKY